MRHKTLDAGFSGDIALVSYGSVSWPRVCAGSDDRCGRGWTGILERTIESGHAGHSGRTGAGERAGEDVLRAKYLDWCSARLASRFVKLTPEEIYSLAERAVVGGGGEWADAEGAAQAPPVMDRDNLSFRLIVERVTEVLASELSLPTFEEWRFAYQAEPDRFEEALLGLWQDRVSE